MFRCGRLFFFLELMPNYFKLDSGICIDTVPTLLLFHADLQRVQSSQGFIQKTYTLESSLSTHAFFFRFAHLLKTVDKNRFFCFFVQERSFGMLNPGSSKNKTLHHLEQIHNTYLHHTSHTTRIQPSFRIMLQYLIIIYIHLCFYQPFLTNEQIEKKKKTTTSNITFT